MEFAEIVSKWKEFGAFGVIILILAKLADKLFIWALDALGVKIKRGQSREDTLIADVAKMRDELNVLNRRFTRVETSYELVHDIAHRAADGIERELEKQQLDLPVIDFFVEQLRSIEDLESLYREAP